MTDTTRLGYATNGRRPFSNGTEGHAWMSTWCSYCIHDHAIHDESFESAGMCQIVLGEMCDNGWPEAWLPEPDDGQHFLPSRMICGQFQPCTKGDCSGDPGADERAERVAEVTAYWRQFGAEVKP